MRYQIEAPVRNFSGTVADVQFRNGTGYVEDTDKPGRAALEYFRRQHYGVAPAEDVDQATAVLALATGEDPSALGPQGTIAQTGGLAPDLFDPSEHNTAEVLSYLDGAGAAEAERVLDAEAVGKARAGVTKQREAILAAKSPEAPAADDQIGATE